MSSAPEPSKAARLVSQLLLEDVSLRDIVAEFVADLAVRIQELKEAREKMDWDQLTLLSHRLKGAAGSYGYPDISRLCAQMEQKFRAHELDQFGRWIAELNELAEAARAGLGEEE